MKKTIVIAAAATLCLGLAGPAAAKGIYKANLNGDNGNPPIVTDTKGKAFLKPKKGGKEMEITLFVKKGTDITQAHIHCGAADQNGVVVVWLAGAMEDANKDLVGLDVNGKWIGKASFNEDDIVNTSCGATMDDLMESMDNGETYVNVHSVANPAGEIRGQLQKSGKKGKK